MKDFLIRFYKEDIEIILEHEDELNYFSLHVNFSDLNTYDSESAATLLHNPTENLKLWNKALISAQEEILKSIKNDKMYMMCVKVNARVRFKNLCNAEENHFPKENDFKKLIQFKGTVIRMTQARMLEIKREYKCLKCKHVVTVHANYGRMFLIEPVTKCKNPTGQCKSSKIVVLNENKLGVDNCIDYQELKIQEQIGNQSIGLLPSTIWVTLEEDLVDSCQPGDDVIVCGVVQRRWQNIIQNKNLDVSLAVRTNSIIIYNTRTKDNDLEPDIQTENTWINKFWSGYRRDSRLTQARDVIINNFCPEIYGMYIIKLAIVLTIVGGVTNSNRTKQQVITRSNSDDDGIRSSQMFSTQRIASQEDKTSDVSVRGQSHLLLVGDPGTGKSELLKFAQKLCSRSVLTTGIGSSSAGLTVAAVREGGEWNLEAGALVLCDGGVCFIDEFTSMKEQDRASIHEAMEQQTISIAKAGMVCKLSTRCSVIAAANPKKKYNQLDTISANIGIAPPLLSRFDLIFILKDIRDQTWDDTVANHILYGEKPDLDTTVIDNDRWTIKMYKAYFEHLQNINPVMAEEAETILSAYYQFKRMSRYRDPSRTTVRLLDSLIRLSQAHARLLLKKHVETIDAITVIILMEYSMISDRLSGDSSLVDLQDPIKAMKIDDYDSLQRQILCKLGVENLVKNCNNYISTERSQNSPKIIEERSKEIVLDENKSCELVAAKSIINDIRSKSFGLFENSSKSCTSNRLDINNKQQISDSSSEKYDKNKQHALLNDDNDEELLSMSQMLEDILDEPNSLNIDLKEKNNYTNKLQKSSNKNKKTKNCNDNLDKNSNPGSTTIQKICSKKKVQIKDINENKNSAPNRFEIFGFKKNIKKMENLNCNISEDEKYGLDVEDVVNKSRDCKKSNKILSKQTSSSSLGMFSDTNVDDIDDVLSVDDNFTMKRKLSSEVNNDSNDKKLKKDLISETKVSTEIDLPNVSKKSNGNQLSWLRNNFTFKKTEFKQSENSAPEVSGKKPDFSKTKRSNRNIFDNDDVEFDMSLDFESDVGDSKVSDKFFGANNLNLEKKNKSLQRNILFNKNESSTSITSSCDTGYDSVKIMENTERFSQKSTTLFETNDDDYDFLDI